MIWGGNPLFSETSKYLLRWMVFDRYVFGVQIPPKTKVFGSLGLVSFWKLCGNFWQKKHQNKKTEDIFNPGKFDLKNTPWVNNKQTFGNNIQGGLYLLIPPTSVFFCVLGRWTEDSVRAWSQDAFPPLSLVMLRLLVGCGGLLLAYLGAKAFLHFRELRKKMTFQIDNI